MKKHQIKAQKEIGRHKVDQFKKLKAKEVQSESKQKTEQEKKLIYKLEREARELEMMEEQLIKRLQNTQDMEKEAFKELEDAMISASMPKRDRLKVMTEVQSNNQ